MLYVAQKPPSYRVVKKQKAPHLTKIMFVISPKGSGAKWPQRPPAAPLKYTMSRDTSGLLLKQPVCGERNQKAVYYTRK